MKNPDIIVWVAHSSIILLQHEIKCQPRRQAYISPDLRKGRSITFCFPAPKEKDVKLSTRFIKGQQGTIEDDQVLWSITPGPVVTDILSV